jgi:hypothetical protein
MFELEEGRFLPADPGVRGRWGVELPVDTVEEGDVICCLDLERLDSGVT